MNDRRRLPRNGRVAASGLQGRAPAEKYTDGELCQVVTSIADLRASPSGSRDRQLLYGDAFLVLEMHQGWAFGQSRKDGYVGYVSDAELGIFVPPTHRVVNRASHFYPKADFKSEPLFGLSFGALVAVTDETEKFCQTAQGGFIPSVHLAPVADLFRDPVSVAEKFIGTPYLWGGNSISGIDCSGLVQMSLLTCGIVCPGDADMQEAEVGEPIGDNIRLQRGDLMFWKGHVALVVDPETLIHANAYHMAVTCEPIAAAATRIAEQGFGPITGRRRLRRHQ